MMKKLDFLWMWLFMLVAATGFVSCTEDDEEGGGNVPKKLLGSWNVYVEETVTFNANGTLVWDYGDGEVETYSYSYDAENKTITYSGYGESETWRIITLTNSKLVVIEEEGYEILFTRVGASDEDGDDEDGDDDDVDEIGGGPEYVTSEPVDLPELQYEEVSGKYVINESESGYASVELTAAGQYFIVPTNSPYLKNTPKVKSRRKSFLAGMKKVGKRGLTDGELMAGNFIQLEINLFYLEGFGYLEVTERDDKGKFLRFILTDENSGTSIPLTVVKQPNMEIKGNTANLCRTWGVLEDRVESWKNGKLMLDASRNCQTDDVRVYVNRYGLDVSDPEEEVFDFGGDVTERIIFSRAGTYACFYRDGEWDISNWRWDDMENGRLTWWETCNGEYEEGQCTFIFFASLALVREEYEEYDEGVLYKTRYTTLLDAR